MIDSQDVIILEYKYLTLKPNEQTGEPEPDWEALGLPNKSSNNSQYSIEGNWALKTFLLNDITSVEENTEEGTCILEVNNEKTYLVKIGFKEALKLIYNKEHDG